MAKLLLNLRDVPDDEADDVRALLDAHGIAWYETRPSPWGVSHGGIWISDADRHAEAKAHLDAYQKRRGARGPRSRPARGTARESVGGTAPAAAARAGGAGGHRPDDRAGVAAVPAAARVNGAGLVDPGGRVTIGP